MKDIKKLLSYSGIRKFQTCKKSYKLRYIDRIETIRSSDALSFGKLIHSCLEGLYGAGEYESIINDNFPDRDTDTWQAHYFALSSAMMAGYVNRYAGDDTDFKVISTEFPYDIPIINPITGRHSRKYRLHGFMDMIVEKDDGIWIVEHKTTAAIKNLLKTVWHDQQIMTYAMAYARMVGKKVRGIIYNVIQKTTMKQGKKETPEQFAARLMERYMTDSDLFHREEIYTDSLRLDEIETELWQITQEIGKCESYCKSRAQCYVFGACEFFPICNSGDNPLIIDQYYKERENDDVTKQEECKGNESF